MAYIYVIKTDYPPNLMQRIHSKSTESIAVNIDEEVTYEDYLEGLTIKEVKEGTSFK